MRARLQAILANPLYLWICLWVIVTLVYLPAWKGGYQQDFEGWMYLYRHLGFWDMLNRKTAGVPSLYQVTQFQLYVITWLFDTRPVLWFLLFTGLHALNGSLFYRLFKGIMEDFRLPAAGWIAGAGMLFAVLCPALTEALVWKACYHYLIGLQAIFWCLIWTRQYLLTGKRKFILWIFLLYVPLTFTLEIWYTIPVMVLLLAAAYRRAGIVDGKASRNTVALLFLPQILLLGCHLLAYRCIYGLWIPHNAYTTPGDNSLTKMLGRIWSYEFHLIFFGRLFPFDTRGIFYRVVGGNAGGIVALLLLLGFGIYAWVRFPKWNAEKRVAALLLGFCIISLGIIMHFEPPGIFLIYNDRYLYFTAFFHYLLLALGIACLFRMRVSLRNIAAGTVLLALVGVTGILVMQWRHATKVFWALQDKFIWKDAPVVLLLNLPCTYNGVGIINAQQPSEFPDHMELYHKGRPQGRIYDVSGYNMQHAWDGAHVTVLDSMHIKVTLNQWGSWWWFGGFGALEYENDLYSLHFSEPGHAYDLTFKRLPPGMIILFQQGLEWRVVDMARVGEEQR